ncbi:MAG: hypothetical protein ACE15F_02880 [bacterium]
MAKEIDGTLPKTANWHRDLLDQMAKTNPSRPAVLTGELRNRLRVYLDFRHVFRQAYSHQLNWQKMAHLIPDLVNTFSLLERELDSFLVHSKKL